MWEFFSDVLDKAGVVATLFTLTLIVAAVIIRSQRKENQVLQTQIQELQEKRVKEARDVTDRIVEYTQKIDKMIGKMAAVVDTIVRMQRSDE